MTLPTEATILRDMYRAMTRRKQARFDRDMAVLQMAREACDKVGLTWEQLTGPGRCRALAAPRHAAWRLMKMRGCSYPEIGRACKRDHSTIVSGVRSAERRAGK